MTRPEVGVVQQLYTITDIAQELGVTNAAVSGWARERDDTPPAKFKVKTGPNGWRYFWDSAGLKAWSIWLENRKKTDRYWRDNKW